MNRATDAGDTADAVDGDVATPDIDRTPADRVMEQLGGVAGIIYSSVPVLVFVGTSRLMGLAAAAGMPEVEGAHRVRSTTKPDE